MKKQMNFTKVVHLFYALKQILFRSEKSLADNECFYLIYRNGALSRATFIGCEADFVRVLFQDGSVGDIYITQKHDALFDDKALKRIRVWHKHNFKD